MSIVSINIEKRMRSQDWPLKEQINVGARFGRRSVGERKRASRSLRKWSVIAVWRCGPVIIQEEVRAAGHRVGREEPPLLLIPALINQQMVRCTLAYEKGLARSNATFINNVLLLDRNGENGPQMTLFL